MKSRQLFPCKDELAIKSAYKILVKHHDKFAVLSNMPIRAKYKTSNAMIWTDFETAIRISAQYIMIVITTFTNRKINKNTVVTLWCRPSALNHVIHAQNVIEDVWSYLLQFSVIKPKLDVVVLPNSQDNNVMTLGLLLQR